MDERYPDIDDLEAEGLLEEYYEKASELERLERINRCEVDTYVFALEYFSEARNPGNPGIWEGFDEDKTENAPDLHLEMTDIFDKVYTEVKNAYVEVETTRSNA